MILKMYYIIVLYARMLILVNHMFMIWNDIAELRSSCYMSIRRNTRHKESECGGWLDINI